MPGRKWGCSGPRGVASEGVLDAMAGAAARLKVRRSVSSFAPKREQESAVILK